MKKITILVGVTSAAFMMLTGCGKKNGDTWDDNATSMGSYRRANQRVLWGDVNGSTSLESTESLSMSSPTEEFITLKEEDLKKQFNDLAVAQPKQSPGEEGSFLPAINGFQTPMSSLASVFKTVHFDTDEHVIKKAQDIDTINTIASYLKANQKTYIFVSGHCDQRGPEAYNLALGTRRANSIRSLLVQKGVNPEQVHTVSYGKEHLVDLSSNTSAWAKNRRAEFRIYQQK